MDRGAWRATAHRAAKSQTRLSACTERSAFVTVPGRGDHSKLTLPRPCPVPGKLEEVLWFKMENRLKIRRVVGVVGRSPPPGGTEILRAGIG